jgi:ABC-type cobalt transport system substrate-binding protein
MDTKNIVLLAIVAILIIAPIAMSASGYTFGRPEGEELFTGTDDQGGSAIAKMYHIVDPDGNNVSEGEAAPNVEVNVTDATGNVIANGTTDDDGNVVLDIADVDKLKIVTPGSEENSSTSAVITSENPNIIASITDDDKLNVTTVTNVTNKTTYTMWFSSIWEPPSGEIESLIFCLQAAIGAIIIGYIFGYWHGGNKSKNKKE